MSSTSINRCESITENNVHSKHAIIGMLGLILYKNPDAPHERASNT